MTELEAYLNGVVYEEELAEEDEEESQVGDLSGEEADPEDENEDPEDDEDEDDDEDEEEEDIPGQDQGESAVAEIKKISTNIKRTIKILGICRVRIEKSPLPPILSFEARREVKKAKQIVKIKSRDFRGLEKRIKRKRTDLKAQFNAEKQKIVSQQQQVSTSLRNLDSAISAAWARFWSKVKSIIVPVLPTIAQVGLFVVIALLVVGIVLSIPSDSKQDEGWAGVGGATGSKFYGVRLLYKDEQLEQTELLRTYGTLLGEAVAELEADQSSIELDIKIEIAEDYDYSNLITDSSKTHELAIITEIASAIYAEDQGSAPSGDLSSTLAGIKYFGINDGATGGLYDEITEKIWAYLNTNSEALIETKDDATVDETIAKNSIKEIVAKNTVRTEKLFVEDVLFTSDTATLALKDEKLYQAMIYMPKTSLTFNNISIKTYGENLDVKVGLQHGETVKDFKMWQEDKLYLYEAGAGLNLTVNAFTTVDTENPVKGALSKLGKLENYQQQLQLAKDENGNEIPNIYTYNRNALAITFESSTPFIFAEAGISLA